MPAAEAGALDLGQGGQHSVADADLAGVRQIDTAQQVEQGRFAGAGRAEQSDELAAADVQAQISENNALLIALGIVLA